MACSRVEHGDKVCSNLFSFCCEILAALNQSREVSVGIICYTAGVNNGDLYQDILCKNFFLFILCNFSGYSVVFAVKFDNK